MNRQKPPVDDERLDKIRRMLAEEVVGSPGIIRDLLALLDWHRRRADDYETMLADAVRDDGRYELGKEAARAELLPVVRSMLASRRMQAVAASDAFLRRMGFEVAGVLEVFERLLTHPAEPRDVPHEQTLARLRRCEDALQRIARGDGDGEDVSWIESSRMWQRIAREALGEA